jgi:putative spermidine/putrescine transport system ATP-binding protein
VTTPSTPLLRVRGLCKTYGASHALAPVDLDIARHEFVTLLGPSGCGKSTLLRMLAGITPADAGTVELAGQRIEGLAPERRDLAMVFQSYALFPHMNVRRNILFGLTMRKLPAPEQLHRLAHAADICNLGELLERMPRQLSGGQQQRVALARALVMQPALMLFDEPLSNLDAKLREQLRDELVQLHRRSGSTSLYVTHDQAEAMAMSDRVVVMSQGRIVESGTPLALYRQPRHEFTARFLGQTNLLQVDVAAGCATLPWGAHSPVTGMTTDGRGVMASLRPEDLHLAPDTSGPAQVHSVSFTGALSHYTVTVAGLQLRAAVSGSAQILAAGQTVALQLRAPLHLLQPSLPAGVEQA